jgi:O-antigen/teichoic acid export membrane protein
LQAINSILAPKIASSYISDKENVQKIINFSTRANFLITIALGAFIIVFNQFILGLFGEEFKSGKIVLIILCLGQIINSISGSVGIILQMIGKQVVQQNFVLIALIINIILTLILTPRYGGVGAAISTVISMAFWNLGCAIYLKMKMGIKTYFYFKK